MVARSRRPPPGKSPDALLYDEIRKAQPGAEKILSLVMAGGDVNAEDPDDMTSSTLLGEAARRGLRDIAQLLIAAGAKLDTNDEGHTTPLLEAAIKGHIEIVRLLVAAGADLDAALPFGGDAEFEARQNGHHEVAALLRRARLAQQANRHKAEGAKKRDLQRIIKGVPRPEPLKPFALDPGKAKKR